MKLLVRESRPRWYGLSWRGTDPAIVLSVHLTLLGEFARSCTAAEQIRSLCDAFGFAGFSNDLRVGRLGFEGALACRDAPGPWIELLAQLPPVRRATGRPCEACRGTGRDPCLRDRPCFSCDGTGQEHVYTWTPAEALAASLALFVLPLEFYEGDTGADHPQLLTVRLGAWPGAFALGGDYGMELAQWLSARPPHTPLPEMTDAMLAAYRHLLGEARTDPFHFRASVDFEGGWLNVSCPGDACGLHPEDPGRRWPGSGYRFGSHNVDSAAQQLTLLAGLAALHDRVDQDLGPSPARPPVP